MYYYNYYHSPLGEILLKSTADALTGLWFAGQKYFNPGDEGCFGSGERNEAHPVTGLKFGDKNDPYPVTELKIFTETKKWLDIYFSGKEPDFTPELKPECSPFRKMVWEIMLSIPYGGTMSYGEIADQVARARGIKKMSAQSVGQAVGHNAISIIIPCHRVVGADGSLTGYGGGLDKKIRLLELEGLEITESDGSPYEREIVHPKLKVK
ncbi:MAG: methylated-DNA--[protein]-cysteine S-methyltransferase [Parasporobacterium sp.]|nr:methylated-DNA--[protein]-cysteine S-methyltransferase [Parasporobacterium sp.]